MRKGVYFVTQQETSMMAGSLCGCQCSCCKCSCCKGLGPVGKTNKNMYGLGFTFFAVFCAFLGLQNLQSSINEQEGLGLTTLTLLYAFFILGCFFTSTFVKVVGTKYSLLAGLCCHLVYMLTNYFPSWYTLVPSSVLLGLASGPVWVAASVHITQSAVEIAPVLKEEVDHLVSRYTGILMFSYQLSSIPGNFLSGVILGGGDCGNANQSDFGACVSTNVSEGEGNGTAMSVGGSGGLESSYYILVSVYFVFIVVAIATETTLLDRFPSEFKVLSIKNRLEVLVVKPVKEMFEILFDWKMLLLTPMGILSGLGEAFVFGTFTEVYISDCLGVCYVGYALAVFGLVAALSSYVVGLSVKYVPRFVVVLIGLFTYVGLLVFLLLWERESSYMYVRLVVFLFCAAWGFGDAIWNTIFYGSIGGLFPRQAEAAYSIAILWVCLGFCLGFILALVNPLTILLGTLLSFSVISALLYLVVGCKSHSANQKEEEEETGSVSGSLDLFPGAVPVVHKTVSIHRSLSYEAALNMAKPYSSIEITNTGTTL